MENKLKNITEYIKNINKFVWKITELGFAIAMAGLVIFLLIGGEVGTFPAMVAANFTNLAASIGGEGLTAILAAVVFILIAKNLINKKYDYSSFSKKSIQNFIIHLKKEKSKIIMCKTCECVIRKDIICLYKKN